MTHDADRIAIIKRALKRVILGDEPAWLETIAPYIAKEIYGESQWNLDECFEVEIIGNIFTVESTVEYSFICKCHKEWVPNIQEFLIEGRFDNSEAVIQKITRNIS